MLYSLDSKQNSMTYPLNTLRRAERALRCSPFKRALWVDLKDHSVPLPQIAGQNGLKQGYLSKILSENQVERELLWLIKVGLLRREVDGQGITDSFRLTPLGRQILDNYESKDDEILFPTILARFQNFLRRLGSF